MGGLHTGRDRGPGRDAGAGGAPVVRRRAAPRGSHDGADAARRRSRRSPTSTIRPATSPCRDEGRVFFTLHPDGKPPVKVARARRRQAGAVSGRRVPARRRRRRRTFESPLSLRIDRQDRLWVLDYADYGRGQPRLLAFDLAHQRARAPVRLSRPTCAGFLSMLNDFQVDPDGEHDLHRRDEPDPAAPGADRLRRRPRKTSRRAARPPSVGAGRRTTSSRRPGAT